MGEEKLNDLWKEAFGEPGPFYVGMRLDIYWNYQTRLHVYWIDRCREATLKAEAVNAKA